MKKFASIFVGLSVLLATGLAFAKSENANSQSSNSSQNGNKTGWESGYNPRSENARNHMSIVAKTVENLLAAADRMEDPGIGEEVREVARHHGQTSEEIAEKEDQINQRSGVAKFFIGPDYAALSEVQQLMEQIRNQVKELNQIRTRLHNEGEEQELQNQIQILEMQLQALQNYVDSEEQGFSLFGWLAKLFS